MSWWNATIGEIANVKGGKRLPEGHQFASEPTSFPYIRARDIGDGKIQIQEPVYLYEQTRKILAQYTVSTSDILITIVGANVGDVGYVSEEFDGANLTENAARLVVNGELAHPYFLKSFLAAKQSKSRLSFIASGAAQGKLGLYKIKSFQVPLPPLNVQRKIADVVKNYDDLIENNQRRIALLEQAARMLYREWFVRFRFPGHEHVKIIDGLPEGWERPAASVVMDILSGGTPKTGNGAFWDGNIGFFTPKDATETPYVLNTEKTITEEGLRACNSKLYPTDTLFITARGTVGKLNLALVPMAMNQSCYALRAKSHFGQRYLYVALKAAIEQVRSRATGAVFDAVIVATFDRIPFLVPHESFTRSFEQSIDPMFDQIANLIQQNQKLAQARDLLLPRLMNGEIAV